MAIPWRKIRRFAEINETKTISFEILIESKTFTWVEFKTIQGTYLVQLVGEYIETMNRRMKAPVFKQPKFVTEPEEEEDDDDEKMSRFAFIKKQIFGSLKEKKKKDEIEENEETYYDDFDAIDNILVSGESQQSSSDADSDLDDDVMTSHQTSQVSIKSKTSSTVKYVDDGQQPGPSTSTRDTSTGYSKNNNKTRSSQCSVRMTSDTDAALFDLNDF